MMKLEELEDKLTTEQPIIFHMPQGEAFVATIKNFRDYGKWKVRKIWDKNGRLCIELKAP